MNRELLIAILALANGCIAAAPRPSAPTHILIQAEHSGWGSIATNLTLTLTDGVYAAASYSVAPALVSNLMAVAQRPWPAPATNTWPRFTIDPANLGLNAAWMQTNYPQLLQAFSGDREKGVLPNASERQRAWLTNALADLEVLGEAVRGCFDTMWTDDYPSLELRFEYHDGKIIEQLLRLHTRAQQSFMLPWSVYVGGKESICANADLNRAVVQILPPGFLNRDRLSGDLFRMIVGQFPRLARVHEFIKKSTLEETLGDEADRLLRGSELRGTWTPGGSYNRFPDNFMATLHRTDWPERLTMPIRTAIERGVVTNLKAILTNAATRVAPLQKQEWLMARLNGPGKVGMEVKSEGSPDHPWLRGHMDKVGRAAFYDRIQSALRRSLGFVLREGTQRSSEWALLEDGRLLLYGFTGDGVLDWKPDELGFEGDARMLRSMSINFVGVYVGADGRITEVVPPERK